MNLINNLINFIFNSKINLTVFHELVGNYKNSYLTTIHGLGVFYPFHMYITIFYSNP